MGDLGADHDAAKADLRAAIRRHEARANGERPALTGAVLSFREVVERQRAPKSAAEQLEVERARLVQLEQQVGGGASSDLEVDQVKEQIRHLERAVEQEAIAARLKRERAADPARAEVRGELVRTVAAMAVVGKEIEAAVEGPGAQSSLLKSTAKFLKLGIEAEALARQYGITGGHARLFTGARQLAGYLRWRLGAPMQLSRMDAAVEGTLTAAVAKLARIVGEGE